MGATQSASAEIFGVWKLRELNVGVLSARKMRQKKDREKKDMTG